MAKAPSMEVFESYFQRADLDRDGRISGTEAVAFFRGSGLPNQTLARIWTFADTSNGGFLGRPEFYNALRLVTVAQSGRELTPDIVKAALYGPAATKIPAPQINPVVGSTSHINSFGPQSGVVTSASSPGFAGPQMPLGAGMSQQVLPPSSGQFTRQPQGTSGGQGPHTGFLGAGSVTAPHGSHPQVPYGGSFTPPVISNGLGITQAGPMPVANFTQKTTPGLGSGMVSLNPQDLNKDSNAPVASGNGFSSVSAFGGSVFSATSQAKQSTTAPTYSASNVLTSASSASATGTQALVNQSQPDPFAGMVSLPNNSSQRPPLGINPGQVGTGLGNPGSMLPTASVGSSVSTSSQDWPRMTPSNIQKYTNVFVKVDSDRDGKITGEEARGLFLSWRLPREVLKQVWDLSDQDSDSMLSLREFCIALYLMECSREGRPLPKVLPDSVKFDPLLPPASQPTTAYGGETWRMASGMPSGRPPLPGMKPSAHPPGSHPTDDVASIQQRSRSRVPVPDRHLVNQLHKEDQNIFTSKFQEAKDSDNKIERAEKEILDSKEKIEFYRTKMQELVLYKSRCDNRLNEITERALADKREMESLGKKYEEKYKQVAEISSKLTIEEASFREIQERKMELHNAIIKMEQGGTVDGLLQVRVDRIQTDLGELVKALNERCKKHGLQMKPTVLVELPFGWQPGIQEGSADWDEDWDKFEDEGFIMVKELTVDVPNITAPEKSKSNLVWNDKAPDGGKSGNSSRPSSPLPRGEIENPEEKSTPESPSHSNGNSFLDADREEAKFASPRDRENYSDHGAAPASSSDGFAVDEWPTFDANDDADSVWGLSSKEPDGEGFKESAIFSSNGLGLNPIRTKESPRADNHFQTRSTFFADSVPGTPFFNSNSPSRLSQMSEEHSYDIFSRFDSFNNHDSGLFAPRETLTRFDSIRSTSDLGGFTSFDDTDPFGSTGPFKTLESETPKYSDLFSSSGTFKSFDQTPKHSDPFGMSSPFKSVVGETPRRISDNWSAF